MCTYYSEGDQWSAEAHLTKKYKHQTGVANGRTYSNKKWMETLNGSLNLWI